MDPPPPYETISRSSTSSSVRSLDHLDPDATGPSQTQQGQTPSIGTTRGDSAAAARDGADRVMAEKLKKKKSRQGGGCCKWIDAHRLLGYGSRVDDAGGVGNYGNNVDGCMVGPRSCTDASRFAACIANGSCKKNYGDNADGCLNYGDRSNGCLNYESRWKSRISILW